MVLAGNDYLAARAKEAGARWVEVVPTVVDAFGKAYSVYFIIMLRRGGGRKTRVGWIGTPETWAAFGMPMMDMLASLMMEVDAVFRAIGAGAPTARCQTLSSSSTGPRRWRFV